MSDYVIQFGGAGDWAISVDDGCLRFHPQWQSDPELTSPWVWREAWQEVQARGGFDAVVAELGKANRS